jgi:hypothetical protein
MQKHTAIIIDCYGPYSLSDAKEVARENFGAGAYVAFGKRRHQKSSSQFQYIGIAANLANRLNEDHENLSKITRERILWLGEVASIGIPGPKEKKTDIQLDLVEWAHAFFLKPRLNNKKTCSPPGRGLTIINRWWRTDFESARTRRPHKELPDIIDYFGPDYGARIVLIGLKVKRLSLNDIKTHCNYLLHN